MGYVLKLTKGPRTLDLSSGRYTLADFVPPTLQGSTGVNLADDFEAFTTLEFTVRIKGNSSAEVRRGKLDIDNLLNQAGDPQEPLYLEWREDNNVSEAPVWGQFGANRRVEVVGGITNHWGSYFNTTARESTDVLSVSMDISSNVEGRRQQLVQAYGGVVEDWIGMVDGQSRGVQVPIGDATNGNKFKNPIFGHATWNTGWTAGADITAGATTSPQFIVFGINAAKLSCKGAGNTYTETINVGNTNAHVLSCYVKLPNSVVPSASSCVLYYGSNQTTTYTSVGDGWYRLTASVTGVASDTATGIAVLTGYTVYADAFQIEERAYPTPFFYGDMLGCSWSGTAHESKSLRTVSLLRFTPSQVLNHASGTIRIIWKAPIDYDDYANGNYVILENDEANGKIEFFWDATNDQWEFDISDPSAPAPGTLSDTFSAGDILVFHLVFSPVSAGQLYLDGVVSVSTSDYNVPLLTSPLYIGSDTAPANHIGGTFLGFSIYNHAMTAAEVLADYNNIAQLVADGQAVDPIPYLWTENGDNVADNEDNGTQENIAVVGGIQGNAPPKIDIYAAAAGTGNTNVDFYFSNLDVEYGDYINPEFLSYTTVGTVSLTNTATAIATVAFDEDESRLMHGRYMSIMLRADEQGTVGINWRTGLNPGGVAYYTPYTASTWNQGSGTFSIDLSPEIAAPIIDPLIPLSGLLTTGLEVVVQAQRLSGTADFVFNSAQVLPQPVMRLDNVSAGGGTSELVYLGGKAYEAAAGDFYYTYASRGGKLKFTPNKYNILISYMGGEGDRSDKDYTLTYTRTYITPRWRTL